MDKKSCSKFKSKCSVVLARDCEAYKLLKQYLQENNIEFEPCEYGKDKNGDMLTYVGLNFKSKEEYDKVADYIYNVISDDMWKSESNSTTEV